MNLQILNKVETVSVPTQDARCNNWAYRNNMPTDENFKCAALEDQSFSISDRDAVSGGLGISGGSVTSYACGFFKVGLRYEFGVGVFKCNQCLAAISAEIVGASIPVAIEKSL